MFENHALFFIQTESDDNLRNIFSALKSAEPAPMAVDCKGKGLLLLAEIKQEQIQHLAKIRAKHHFYYTIWKLTTAQDEAKIFAKHQNDED